MILSQNRKTVIAVGADHYNTLWIVRSLGIAGFYPIAVIIGEHERSFVGASRYCKECYITNDNNATIKCLMSLQIQDKTPIIASGDYAAELLDANYDLLSSKYILHDCEGKGGRIIYWMNKTRMLDAARKCGLNVPLSKSLDLKKTSRLDEVPFPCLIKPEKSTSATKNSFRICNSQENLDKAILEIQQECSNVVLQEFIQKDYEFLVYGVRTMSNEIILPGGLRKVHLCNAPNNMGMMSYSFVTSEIPKQIGDFEGIKTFIEEIDFHGVFSVEFIITQNTAYFIEINLRNDGTIYCTTQAGVNMPALWAASVFNLDTSQFPRTYKRVRTYGMNETNYVKYTLRSQPIMQSLREIFKVKAFSLIKWNDMFPLIAKIIPGLFAYKSRIFFGGGDNLRVK